MVTCFVIRQFNLFNLQCFENRILNVTNKRKDGYVHGDNNHKAEG
jgi:hypothetical protein